MLKESSGDGSKRALQIACLIFNVVFCTVQVLYWIYGINPYGDLSIPMAPAVSLFLICASALAFLRGRSRSRKLSTALSAVACLLLAYIVFLLLAPERVAYSIDLGSIFVSRSALSFQSITLGRISPLSGLIIILILVCDLVTRHARIRWLSRLLFVPAAALSVVMLFGYAFGSPFLYESGMIPVSLPTSIACIALCLSFLLANDDLDSMLSVFRGASVTAQLLRAFVPFCTASVLLVSLIDPIRPALALNPALLASVIVLIIIATTVFLVMRISSRIGDRLELAFAELRSTKAALQEAVAERDLYLKETHHRVKNNLQLVISLLNLGRDKVNAGTSDQCDSILASTIERIEGMAIIHDRLYRGTGIPLVELRDFVGDLSRSLTFDRGGKEVRFDIDVGQSRFGLGVMLPLGLILNELATNSLKYAFAATPDPRIAIAFLRVGNLYRLTYADNGSGLPASFDTASATTLGMVLIDSLVRQMRGTLRFENRNGLRCEIAFPAEPDPD